jgi:HPt (histidine-containing phosphotransfer) domain-containing protein
MKMNATQPPTLDFERVEEATGGDYEFMKELVDLFLEDATERLRELEAALATNDAEQLGKCAHKLKGSSANVGADHMSHLAKSLEERAKQSNLDQADELVAMIARQLSEVGPRFHRYIESHGS